MSLIPLTEYPGQTDGADPGYPAGKARNASTFQDGTGTPLERAWVNDIWGFLQSLLVETDITPDGNPDAVGASQYLQAVQHLIARAAANFLSRVTALVLDATPPSSDILAAAYNTTTHLYLISKGSANGTYRIADDGLGAVVATSGTVTGVRSAAFDPVAGRVVLVGTAGGFVCHSTNFGTTWTDAVTPLGARDCVVWDAANALFLASRVANGNINTSPTGVTWTARALTANCTGGVAVNPGTGVGVAQIGLGASTAFNRSTNGTVWAASGGTIPNVASADSDVSGGNGATVVYLDGNFYNCARFGAGAEIRIHRSADGITWTLVATLTDTAGTLGFPRIISDQFAHVLYVVSQVSGAGSPMLAWSSFDGETWSEAVAYLIGDVNNFAAAGGRLFMTEGTLMRMTAAKLPEAL